MLLICKTVTPHDQYTPRPHTHTDHLRVYLQPILMAYLNPGVSEHLGPDFRFKIVAQNHMLKPRAGCQEVDSVSAACWRFARGCTWSPSLKVSPCALCIRIAPPPVC